MVSKYVNFSMLYIHCTLCYCFHHNLGNAQLIQFMENAHHMTSVVKPVLIVKPISQLRLTFLLKESDLIIFSWQVSLYWNSNVKIGWYGRSLAMVCRLGEIKALRHPYFLPQPSGLLCRDSSSGASLLVAFFVLLMEVLGVEPRTSWMLSMSSTTEFYSLHPQEPLWSWTFPLLFCTPEDFAPWDQAL